MIIYKTDYYNYIGTLLSYNYMIKRKILKKSLILYENNTLKYN